MLGAGPAAAASDITFSGVPPVGDPGQIYVLTAVGGLTSTITASTTSDVCQIIDQDQDTGLDFISVAVDLDDQPQPPGTCTITATDSTGSAMTSFNTEGQDQVNFTSSPPAPSLAGAPTR